MNDAQDNQQTSPATSPAPGGDGHPPASKPPINKKSKKGLLIGLTIIVLIGLIGYGIYWFVFGSHFEDTDDAYVGGNVVQITPQVSGTVLTINGDDTDTVQAGQLLLTLDQADAKLALNQAEAKLAQTVRQVRTYFVKNNALDADIRAKQDEVKRDAADLARRQTLLATGAVSREEVEHARTALQVAQAALTGSREQAATNLALTSGTNLRNHPDVLHAASDVRIAWLNLARTSIPAPVSGYIAKRSVQLGQQVQTGMPLMSIVPLNQLWVDANFKEVQLAHMRVGQPATLTADIYGSSIEYKGTVVGFGAGTGSAFSLLPAQNASGNWIKVVQRVPVRIRIDPQLLQTHPLRLGVSMDVKVDIAHDDGSNLSGSNPVRGEPLYQTAVYKSTDADADRAIEKIISDNDGMSAAPAKKSSAKVALVPGNAQ